MQKLNIKPVQSTRPIPTNEAERLATLFELDLDYVNLNNSFEDLSYLAAKITGTEMSLISFIDSYTQWIVSRFGLEIYQTPIDDTVCQYTIMEDDHLEIEDLSKDKRFDGKGIADEPMNLRYYFGIPLKTNSGYNIGSLCVLDTNFHKLSKDKIDQLKIIAKQVIARINDTNAIKTLEKKLANQNETYKKVAHDIRGPIAGIIGLADMINNDKDEYPSEELHNIVGMMGKSGQSVLDLADEILKNSLKDTVYAPEVFTLRIFKEKLEKLYQPQAFNKRITLDVQANIAFDTIQIKKEKLLQISGNLISNAIKFTPNEGRITVILDLILDTDKKTLVL
ncbi:MAG: GAF domain-containing sensor histidine kinase, partial [Pedobacter sp.]